MHMRVKEDSQKMSMFNKLIMHCDEFKTPQSAFTCSKLTIETLEQGVKYFQS